MEKMNSGRYSEGEDLEPKEIYVRDEGTGQHASVLKKDFEKGVGYRLSNSTMFSKDSMFKTLKVSQRDFYFLSWILRCVGLLESCVSI
jgi:hypothetical protein